MKRRIGITGHRPKRREEEEEDLQRMLNVTTTQDHYANRLHV